MAVPQRRPLSWWSKPLASLLALPSISRTARRSSRCSQSPSSRPGVATPRSRVILIGYAMVATRSMARGSQGRARGLGVEARAASIVASPRPPLSRPRTALRRFAPAWTTHSSRTSRGPERERSASSSGRVGVCMAAAPWPASVVTAVNMCVPLSFNSLSLSRTTCGSPHHTRAG